MKIYEIEARFIYIQVLKTEFYLAPKKLGLVTAEPKIELPGTAPKPNPVAVDVEAGTPKPKPVLDVVTDVAPKPKPVVVDVVVVAGIDNPKENPVDVGAVVLAPRLPRVNPLDETGVAVPRPKRLPVAGAAGFKEDKENPDAVVDTINEKSLHSYLIEKHYSLCLVVERSRQEIEDQKLLQQQVHW